MTCPSTSLCVAGDDSGNVVTSTNPTGGAAAWKVTHLSSEPIIRVACASSSLCVAVAGHGDEVFTSTNPTGGAAAWSETDGLVDSSNGSDVLSGLSCPSTSLCVASDLDGSVLYSTNPTGGTGAWTRVALNGAPNLTGISCPSTSLCVAVTGLGQVITSTNPTGQAAAWNTVQTTVSSDIGQVSCPSTSLCVAVDDAGNVLSSTAPTGNAAAWTVTSIGTSIMTAISCASTSLCAVTDDAGDIVTSTNPTGDASNWNAAVVDQDTDISFAGGGVGPISCPSTSLCVAAGAFDGNALIATNPTGGADAWQATSIDTYQAMQTNHPTALSCPTTTFCAAVDSYGNVVTTTNPVGDAQAWTIAHIDDRDLRAPEGDILTAISCPSASLCVAVDYRGNVLTSTDPTGGAGAWKKASIDPGNQLSAVSCASATLCVAVDYAGNALASTNPTGGAGKWTSTDIDGSEPLRSVSCATGPLCVAGDSNGLVMVSTDPTDNSSTWTPKAIPAGYIIAAASCPTSSFCVAGATNGVAWVSHDPTGSPSTWTGSSASGSVLTSLSCSSESLCAISDLGGSIEVSANLGTASPTWTEGYNTGYGQSFVSCPSDGMCVGVYDTGNAVAGLIPPSATLGAVGAITTTSATLTGTVNPNGFKVTDCHFAYGGNPSNLTKNAPCNVQPGSGTSDVAVSADLSGLAPSTFYSYALVAGNATGNAQSDTELFSTEAAASHVICVVPKLKGKTLAAARSAIGKAHCGVGKITRVKSSKKNKGHVISQSPAPGKHLKKGSKVALKIGK
jgi:PASTA domain